MRTTKTNLGVLMIDMNYFKKYNDNYGHIAGNLVIQEISKIASDFTSEHNGFAARYGGENLL